MFVHCSSRCFALNKNSTFPAQEDLSAFLKSQTAVRHVLFFLSESAKKLRVVSFAKPFQLFNLRMCRRFSARLPLPQDSPLIATILENHEMFEIIDSSQFNLLWNKVFIFPTLFENQSLYNQKFSKKCCISGRILKRYLKRG